VHNLPLAAGAARLAARSARSKPADRAAANAPPLPDATLDAVRCMRDQVRISDPGVTLL
jgi:hypothetical protein